MEVIVKGQPSIEIGFETKVIQVGSLGDIDSALSTESENPVMNKVITAELNQKATKTELSALETKVTETDEKLAELSEETSGVKLNFGINDFPFKNQGFFKGDAGIRITTDDRYMLSDYISANSGDQVIYQGATSSSMVMMGVVFADENKNYLSEISLAFGNLKSNEANKITIPDGVSFVRFSASQAGDFVGVYKYSRIDKVAEDIKSENVEIIEGLHSEIKDVEKNTEIAITLLQHDGLLPELDEEAEEVNDAALNYDCDFRFLVFTDVHSLDEQRYRKYRNIMEKGVIDMTLGLGDYNPYKHLERSELKKEINKMLTIAGKGENNVYAVGNHEFMASFDWVNTRYDFADNQPKISNDYVFTKREMFEMTTRHLANRAVFNENDPYGCYYYLDYEPQKIRVIVLNSSDIYEPDGTLQHLYVEMMTMQQEQISWYANKALDFTEKDNPSEWSVMVCLHHYYMSNAIHNILAAAKNGVSIDRSWTSNRRRIYDEATKKYLTDTIQGEEGAITITINKDFSQQGAINVIGIIHGHSHNDVTRELSGGIKALEFMTDNSYLNHRITAPLNGLAKGTYFFVTNRGQKMQFTLDEALPNARAIAYNHYFDNPPSGHEEVYIFDEKGQIIKFWGNMLAMDSVTGTEIAGFVDTQTERVDEEKCSIVCIDKETKTIKCFPYGNSTYREVQY